MPTPWSLLDDTKAHIQGISQRNFYRGLGEWQTMGANMGGTNHECLGVVAGGTPVWLRAGGQHASYAQGTAQGICGNPTA